MLVSPPLVVAQGVALVANILAPPSVVVQVVASVTNVVELQVAPSQFMGVSVSLNYGLQGFCLGSTWGWGGVGFGVGVLVTAKISANFWIDSMV